MSDVTFEVL